MRVVDGLGLVPFLVDVHSGQWGTLPRLIESVLVSGRPGMAIDEDTVVTVQAGEARVAGRGHVHVVRPGRRWCDGGPVPRGRADPRRLIPVE